MVAASGLTKCRTKAAHGLSSRSPLETPTKSWKVPSLQSIQGTELVKKVRCVDELLSIYSLPVYLLPYLRLNSCDGFPNSEATDSCSGRRTTDLTRHAHGLKDSWLRGSRRC